MTIKTTPTPASGTHTLFNRDVDWRDVIAASARTARSAIVFMLDRDELFDENHGVFMAVSAAVDLLDELLKKRPGPATSQEEAWLGVIGPLYKIHAVLQCARAALGDVDTYSTRALDDAIKAIAAGADIATDLCDEAERTERQTQERTERAIKARRARKAEAKQKGGAHEH